MKLKGIILIFIPLMLLAFDDEIHYPKSTVSDKSYLGIPRGASPQDLIQRYQTEPQGILKFNEVFSGYIYDWNKVFIFKNDRLCGVNASDSYGILDYHLLRLTEEFSKEELVPCSWLIEGKFDSQTSLEIAARKMGEDTLQRDLGTLIFETEKLRFEVNFSGPQSAKEKFPYNLLVMDKEIYEEFIEIKSR